MEQNTKTFDRISKLRTHLFLDNPWFGSLAMRLKLVETTECKTMETNGTVLRFNPDFCATLRDKQIVGVLAHEVLHCALLHPYRAGSRDMEQWNVACDFVINSQLSASGFELPANVLMDHRFDKMAAEQVYALISQEKQDDPNGDPQDEQQQGSGEITAPDQGNGDPDPNGEPQDAPGAEESMSETDWQVAAEQATLVAQKAGKMPGGVAEALSGTRESDTNWREILKRFIEETTPSDYSFSKPNRRYISSGLYLPGVIKEGMGTLVWVTDTSASMDVEALNAAWGEFAGMVRECKPERVLYIGCDTEATLMGDYGYEDIPDAPPEHPGRGGTLFAPAYNLIADLDVTPAVCLYFTDLENGDDVLPEPDYPVLWITDMQTTANGPFGETVHVSQFN